MLSIHAPSTPRHLRITQTMVEDFLIDPVLGVKVIWGLEMDDFQKSRLRTYWWIPNVIDSSGVGTGKTLTFWLFMNLRALIIPDQKALVMYQRFQSGKDQFWPYYRAMKTRSRLFEAQLGKVDLLGEKEGKDNSQGASCYIQYFKNDSEVRMPAPDWMQGAEGQKGTDINVLGVDEWTLAEAAGAKQDGRTGTAEGGINKQLLSRVRRSSYNQHHPLWGNHRVFMASAESPSHPAYKRYKAFQKRIAAGDPHYALISYSYRDYSHRICHTGKSFRDEFRNETMLQNLRSELTPAEYKRQALGLWERETAGWYSEAAMQRCVAYGTSLGLQPETHAVTE
jgi:hypothetical protein